MKKVRVLSFVLVLMLLFATFASAAGTVSEDGRKLENDDAVLTVQQGVNATLAFGKVQNVESEDKISVTVNSSALEAGEQVLILMAKCDAEGNPNVSDGNVYFIDQKAVETAGSITFDVYPSSMSDSVIFITSEKTGQIKAVLVEGKLTLGNVDGVGGVDISDVALLLRYVVGLVTVDDIHMNVADVDGVTGVDISDVALLLRVVVGLAEL